jgi:2-C-methyl-D-erythritol 2,4-cyclodiphosphate synthase
MKGKETPLAPPALLRAGIGNDIHPLVPGRPLVLGGVLIPFDRGPQGHSDGDALAHAICDALLGAAGLGDLGTHFSDASRKWRNASSLEFLRRARKLLDAAGCSINNIDATISIEKPKLRRYIAGMREAVALALGVEPGRVSIKAKRGEGLDAVGRGEAVRADAIALVEASVKQPRARVATRRQRSR